MPKYLGLGSYTAEGWKGIEKEHPTHRREFIANFLASVGGKLESYYFTVGDHDFVWIADYPDHITAAAIAVAVQESGMVKSHQTLLLTADDMDAALKKHVAYRAPGV